MKRKFFLSVMCCIGSLMFSGASALADIMIGVAAPFTGPNAVFGEQYRQGVSIAARIINAQGGILGEKIRIVIGDDMGDPRQGISVANKFVADGIKFVIGHFNSGVSIPASEVYAENNILQMSPSSTHPILTERGLWNVFRIYGRDDKQGRFTANYIAKRFPNKKIAILHDKTAYGQGLAEEVRKTLHELGAMEIMYEGVNVGEKDFSALIEKMKHKNVSLIYWGGLHTEVALLIRQMPDQGFYARIISGDGIVSKEFAAIAGDGVLGTLNTFCTFGKDPIENPENREVLEQFKSSGFSPEAYSLFAYTALQVIAEAIEMTGSVDTRKVAGTLKQKGPFKTIMGGIRFNEKGDPDLPNYKIYEWKKDEYGRYFYSTE